MNNQNFSDRRSGQDRRVVQERHHGTERRSGSDRRLMGLAETTSFPPRAPGEYRLTARPLAEGGRRLEDRRGGQASANYTLGTREILHGLGAVLTDLVSSFYDACMDPKLWPDALGKLRDATHADAAAVISHDFETGRGQLDHSVSIDAMFVTAYGDFYGRQNLWLQRQEHFRQPGKVWTGEQLADEEVVETDFYRYWLRPQNLFHHLFGVLDVQGNRVMLLSFARAREKGAFWEDDAELLASLLPHLRQGLRAGQSYRRVQDLERILVDTLDVMPMGIVLLTASGMMLTANRSARDIIDTEEALYHGNGGLGVKLATGRFRFRDFLAGSLGKFGGDPSSDIHTFSVPREGDRRPITLLVMPVRDRTHRRGDNDPAAVLFIGDPERPVDIDPRRLVGTYGLSRAEARVGVLLAKGLRLEQVAEQLGLTYETVRKHLKQIFSKTGTDRQAELVRTLTSGPSGLRL